eukprot:CAMPEP_0171502694 /NCGR_PEP_ID=MMETSP0958-20121227/10347_1 /TAXON_ID=87120 /ORGANISM="Aurantiochytrium limacinum, Strain ATCCMYA-1381" /LENGTH=53 /DNA_ID=CAMNT_0012037831 /DNA_START=94 /DNA_END=251 /DNA_ORIENTATION=-
MAMPRRPIELKLRWPRHHELIALDRFGRASSTFMACHDCCFFFFFFFFVAGPS